MREEMQRQAAIQAQQGPSLTPTNPSQPQAAIQGPPPLIQGVVPVQGVVSVQPGVAVGQVVSGSSEAGQPAPSAASNKAYYARP